MLELTDKVYQREGFLQMKQNSSEGIVLDSLEFKERERIIKVFTLEEGLLTIIVKGISKKQPALLALTSPLCIIDLHYLHGRSEIHRFTGGSVKEPLLFLRSSLPLLQTAAQMANTILRSQQPEKSSPALYLLLKAYLINLSRFTDPSSLLASFYLKLLLHDGVLSLAHRPPLFSCEEWSLLLLLAQAKQFDQLIAQTIAPHILEKMSLFTQESLHIGSAKANAKKGMYAKAT